MELWAALQFLTRLPIPLRRELSQATWARSMAWFPLVGLVVGLLLVGGRWATGALWPQDLAAALTLALWVVLTGGLHLDGLVDCCDALWVAAPPERRLEILRDVHVGSYGLVGGALFLLLKWRAIVATPWPGLILAPILGRWAMVYVTWAFPYARPSGLGKMFQEFLGRREMALASATALLAVTLCGGWRGLGVALAGWLAAWALASWAQRRLGTGLTGDVYGLVCEMVELVILLGWGVHIA
jgi:adenosylcobinamide-GDP ribazoletransferase